MGFPFLAGFFRKDLILEGAYNQGVARQVLVWFLIGVGLTTVYRVKLLSGSLLRADGGRPAAPAGGGVGGAVKAPSVVLALGAVWGGAGMSTGANPSVVGGTDKVMPLLFIGFGATLGLSRRVIRVPYLVSM